MGRLCVLAIILLASPTLPREVLVLESSTFPVTLPTVGALDVATCADLNATAADLVCRRRRRPPEREMFKKIGVKGKHLSYEEWYAEFVTEK